MDKLNLSGEEHITAFVRDLLLELAHSKKRLSYSAVKNRGAGTATGRGLRASLGTIPDYANSRIKGVLLSGVRGGSPASAAGLRTGDIVVELAGKKIENIYDYTFVIQTLKVGQKVKISVKRSDAIIESEITPASRD